MDFWGTNREGGRPDICVSSFYLDCFYSSHFLMIPNSTRWWRCWHLSRPAPSGTFLWHCLVVSPTGQHILTVNEPSNWGHRNLRVIPQCHFSRENKASNLGIYEGTQRVGPYPVDSHGLGVCTNSGAQDSMHYLQRICCRSPKPYLRLADVKSNIPVTVFFSPFFQGAWGLDGGIGC